MYNVIEEIDNSKIVIYPKRDPGSVEAIVHACIDFRFHKLVEVFVENLLEGKSFDLKTGAGTIKAINEDNSPVGDWILKNIEIAERHHHIKQVLIVMHWDCAAYGGSQAFANPDEEESHYTEEAFKAAAKIREKFGSLQVRAFLTVPVGSYHIGFKELVL